MASPAKAFVKAMYKKFRYYGNWAPGEPRKLGDYGRVENGYFFDSIGNIHDDFGTAINVREDSTADSIEHQAKSGVEFAATVSGKGANAEGKLSFAFSKKGAFVLKANRVVYNSIANMTAIAEALRELRAAGRWDSSWRLITHLADAGSATILISSSSNGKIEIGAKGDEGKILDIASVDVSFAVSFYTDMETKIVASSGLQPMFRLASLQAYSPESASLKSLGALRDPAAIAIETLQLVEEIPLELLLEDDEDA